MLILAVHILLLAFVAQVSKAVSIVNVQGANFVNSNSSDRFIVVGVAYQPGGSSGFNPQSGVDPLSDGAACLRDAALLQRLGVNAIRVYSVDPDLNHDLCVSIFNDAGIYLMIDVNSPLPNQSIDRSNPAASYNTVYLNRTFAVVEAFKLYPNTLLYFAGNEIINDVPTASTAPYIRAVTRDIRNYISKHSNRSIAVGYSAADVREVLVDTFNYLTCTTTGDSNDPSRSNIFALNSYSWCGMSNFQMSGYDVLVGFFQNTSAPVFFSEYGCNTVLPREFTEVQAIYGPQMTPTMSGGVVYQYTQDVNNFGLVIVNGNGSAQLRSDYDALQSQYNMLDFNALEGSKPLNTSNAPPACSASLISTSGFPTNFTIPSPPPGTQDLIDNGITNPNNGQLITVTNFTVSQVVADSNGTVITGLAVKPLPADQENGPGQNPGTTPSSNPGPTSTNASPAASTSKKSAADKIKAVRIWFFVAGAVNVILNL